MRTKHKKSKQNVVTPYVRSIRVLVLYLLIVVGLFVIFYAFRNYLPVGYNNTYEHINNAIASNKYVIPQVSP